MMDCVFCKIAAGMIPSTSIYEDELIFAFRDIHPMAPCHVLIIPRKHYSSLNDIGYADSALLGHMVLTAQKLAREEGVTESGYRLVINCGPQGGQVVPHLHLHLLGGRQLSGELG
jgi:histidine triad (HIT) family protein